MEKSFVTSDGARLVYRDVGQGEALIFLHGWSQSAAMFHHQVAAFSPKYRVFTPDFRGHGASPRAERGYRISRFAVDVAEMMDHAGIARASVVGCSMGASVLWAYIDQYGTSRLDRCVFLDEPASVMRQVGMTDEDAQNAGVLFDAATMMNLATQIAAADGHAAREDFLGAMVTKGIPDDLRAWLVAQNLLVVGADVAALFVNHCSLDWRDVFDRVDVPTLVIGGQASHVAVRSQEWICGRVKGSELIVFAADEGGAHFPFIENPALFNEALSRFLSGQATAGRGA